MNRNFVLKINKSQVLIAILVLLSIDIDSLPYILPSMIANVLNRWIPILICLFMLFLIIYRKKISKTFLLILCYFAFLAVVTLLRSRGAFISYIYQIAPFMALSCLTEYYMSQKPGDFLKAVQVVLIFLIVVDLITMVLYPNGMYSSDLYTLNWFLGYKTARVRVATMPVIMFSAILSVKKENKLNIKFWTISSLALIDTLLPQGTGGVVTIMVMLLLLFFLFMFKNERIRIFIFRLFNFRFILLGVLLMTFAVNILQNFSALEPIITGIFGKDMTLSGRLRIWTSAIQLIRQSPILGNGYINASAFASLVGMNAATQPHSLFLAVLVYSGVTGLIIYLLLLNTSFSYLKKTVEGSATIICAIYIVCMLIHGIVSMHLFSQFLYPAMIMIYYLNVNGNGNTDNNKRMRV